jgi:Zn-dependent protease with chaperone function
VLPVYTGIGAAAEAMGAAGAIGDPDSTAPSWLLLPLLIPSWILTAYLRVFESLDSRISRSREQRADMIAAQTCGTQSFKIGLRKFVGIARTFAEVAPQHILEGLKNQKPYDNYYAVFRQMLPQLAPKVREHEKEARSWLGAPGEDHPPLSKRLEYVPEVPERFEDTAPAAALIENLEQYEKTLTENYTCYVVMMVTRAAD